MIHHQDDVALFRLYKPEDAGADGYPVAWHSIEESGRGIKHLVRADAGDRCVRCGHPYTAGDGEWSRCDEKCEHGMPARCVAHPFEALGSGTTTGGLVREAADWIPPRVIEAQWRILTVHHLDGNKLNCRWWNLAPLCQRDHLLIQRKVVMGRPWPWEHTEWFKPYAAGFYAYTFSGIYLTRREAEEQLGYWLAIGMREAQIERMA